jgi:hypothetical protein
VVTLDFECFLILDDILNRLKNLLPQHHSTLESQVPDTILQSVWENLLVAVPFVGILLVALFRLDQIIAAPRRRKPVSRPACGCDENGRMLLSDPDGRPWND